MKRSKQDVLEINRGKRKKVDSYFKELFSEYLEHDLLIIDKSYLEDSFNAYGIFNEDSHIERLMFRCLSNQRESDENELRQIVDFGNDKEEIDKRLIEMYGRIHARYLLTTEGCEKAYDMWRNAKWGKCEKETCNNFHLLPYGKTYEVNKCECIFYCGFCGSFYSKRSCKIDGAYFGNWFIHYFFLEYPQLRINSKKRKKYKKETIYGFELSSEEDLKKAEQNTIKPTLPSRTFIKFPSNSD